MTESRQTRESLLRTLADTQHLLAAKDALAHSELAETRMRAESYAREIETGRYDEAKAKQAEKEEKELLQQQQAIQLQYDLEQEDLDAFTADIGKGA
jgi:hypothetical protein